MPSLFRIPVTRERLSYGIVLAIALGLRLWDLGARSLWFDEGAEYWVATAPIAQLAHAVSAGSGDPPLYSFLLHFWMKLGTSEAWLRLLSTLASVAGVAGLMVLGRRLGGFAVALAAGGLAAVNTPDIRYAQDVGQYAPMMSATVWNWVALHALWSAGSRKRVFAWALTAFLATTAYYAAACTVLVPFACAGIESLVRRDRARVQRFAIALGLFVLVTVPALWNVLPDQMSRVLDTRAVMADYAQARPKGFALVWRWLANLFGFHFSGWPYTLVPGWIPVVCCLALLAAAVRGRARWALWFGATWAAYGIAALLELFPFGFRWGLILWAPTVAMVAVGFALGARERWFKVVAALAYAGLIVSSAISLPNLSFRKTIDPTDSLAWPETEEMRPVMEYWHQNWRRSQPTYVFYGAAPAFAYYAHRYRDVAIDLPATWSIDCWHGKDTPAYCRQGNIYFGRWLRSLPTAEEKVMSISQTLGVQPREFWLVFSHVQGPESVDIIQQLKAGGYKMSGWREGRAAGAVLMTLE